MARMSGGAAARRAAVLLGGTALLMSLAACTGPDSPPAPMPAPSPSPPRPTPNPTGKLLVQALDYSVWSISRAGAGYTGRRLTPPEGIAALSPDRRTLAYVTGSDIAFLNLGAGKARRQSMSAGGKRVPVEANDFGNTAADSRSPFPACLSWAPDGRHLTFLDTDGDLYVGTPDGHATLVDRPRTADYQTSKILPFGSTYRSYVGCGAWLDARRFAFDRLAHAMPRYIAADTVLVYPDVTAVATLTGPTVNVVDSGGEWRLDGVCGTRLLVTDIAGNSATPTVVTGTGTAALTRPGGPSGTPLPSPLADGVGRFVPGSCALVVVSDGSVYRYDPATAESTTISVAQPLDGAFLLDPADFAFGTPTLIAGVDRDLNGSALQLFDLSTGGVAELLPSGPGDGSLPGDQVPQQLRGILGWLPPVTG